MKTEKLKNLQGTLKKCRVKVIDSEKVDFNNILDLSEEEQGIVDTVVTHLENADASKSVDILSINLTARLLSVIKKSANEIIVNNGVHTYKNGTKQVSAEWTIFKQGIEMFNDMSDRLGLDPKARLKLEYFHRADNKKEEDPIMKLIKNA